VLKVGAGEIRLMELGVVEDRRLQVGDEELRPLEVGATEDRFVKLRLD
jgi:hypothetical protein